MWRQLGLIWLAGFGHGHAGDPVHHRHQRAAVHPARAPAPTSLFTLVVLLFALGVATLAIGWRTQHTAQLVPAYTCGGLPFALVAGLLAKPKRMNMAAAGLTTIALLSGFALLDGRLSTLVLYLQMMFGPVATPW